MLAKKYLLAPHLYASTLGQDVILLDLAQPQKDRHYALVRNGAAFFSAILQDDIPESPNQEVEQAIAACLNAGWLCDQLEEIIPHSAPRTFWWAGRLPYHLEALLLFTGISRALQHSSFLSVVQALMERSVHQCNESDPRVPTIIRAARESAQLLHTPVTCLHQSLAICWMLRARGIPAQISIRVQQDPLVAHMIVVDGPHILSWKPGLTTITTLEHFLKATTLLFHSGEMDVHYRWKDEEI